MLQQNTVLQNNRQHNMSSNGIFPNKNDQNQKRNFTYKSRTMAHKVRPVEVRKDSKDVRFKPPGTDNERYQRRLLTPPDRNMKISERNLNQKNLDPKVMNQRRQDQRNRSRSNQIQQNINKNGQVQQNRGNGDAQVVRKPNVRSKNAQKPKNTMNSANSANPDPNSVTLSENQFSKILQLISSARLDPTKPQYGKSEEDLIEQYVNQINNNVANTNQQIQNLAPPVNNVQDAMKNIQSGGHQQNHQNPQNHQNNQNHQNQALNHRDDQSYSQNLARNSGQNSTQNTFQNTFQNNSEKKRHNSTDSTSSKPSNLGQYATQSSFQIGGDGTPDISQADQRKIDQKKAWLADLQEQREEQARRKQKEKQSLKEENQVRKSWGGDSGSGAAAPRSCIKMGIDMNARDSMGDLLTRPDEGKRSREVSNVSRVSKKSQSYGEALENGQLDIGQKHTQNQFQNQPQNQPQNHQNQYQNPPQNQYQNQLQNNQPQNNQPRNNQPQNNQPQINQAPPPPPRAKTRQEKIDEHQSRMENYGHSDQNTSKKQQIPTGQPQRTDFQKERVENGQNYPYFGGDEKKKLDKHEQWKADLANQIKEREAARNKIVQDKQDAIDREDARIKQRF